MANVKNVTPDRLHLFTPDAPPVEPGDTVEISDERFADRAWPKSTWQVTKKPGKGYTDASTDDATIFLSSTPDDESPAPETDDETENAS